MTDQEFLRVFLRGWPPGDRFGHCDAMGVLTVDEAIERVPLFLHKGPAHAALEPGRDVRPGGAGQVGGPGPGAVDDLNEAPPPLSRAADSAAARRGF